jgi:hypothetical protein
VPPASCRYQRSAVATWKVPTSGELAIEFGDDGLRLVEADVETAAVGKNQALLVQAQMHRVGAQPARVGSAAGGACALAEDPESGVGDAAGEAEGVAEASLRRTVADVAAVGCARSACSGRGREGVESFAVVGFGPDEFGDDKGELHAGGPE